MSSDNDTDINMYTPPDIVNAATAATNNLLPNKSRAKYEKAYRDFIDWRMDKCTTSFSENVLLAYFQDLSNKFSSASLWTIYSMIKSMLNIRHEVDIAKYCKLTALLKRKAEGYQAKKSRVFTPGEINKFLTEAPDQLYLQSKVGLIFRILGACRRQELYNIKFSDVKSFEDTIIVTVRNTKTKTDRTFTITGSHSTICKQYMELRPNDCSEPSFFLFYNAGKCTKQRIGINKFGNVGKTVASFLNLPDPELYTGHCFRRTSATILVDGGGDITALKRHGGWKSTNVAEGYINESIQNKVKISNQNKVKISNQNKVKISNQILNHIQNKDNFCTFNFKPGSTFCNSYRTITHFALYKCEY